MIESTDCGHRMAAAIAIASVQCVMQVLFLLLSYKLITSLPWLVINIIVYILYDTQEEQSQWQLPSAMQCHCPLALPTAGCPCS